jgi:8-oxo-dGTP pyrophosphatase MutT (NUDIX family)
MAMIPEGPVHRKPLLDALERYRALHPEEAECAARLADFVRAHEDCFLRSCLPGHVTASAWILSHDRERFLLTHHAKLDRWLQLGGHADGDADTAAVALREAREESGMSAFELVWPAQPGVPFDLDIHEIPARGAEPAHLHHDVRYLLVAAPGQELRVSAESHELAWFERARAAAVLDEPSQLRMACKAERWLQATTSVPSNASTSARTT